MDGTFLFGLGTGLSAGVVIAPLLAVAARAGRFALLRPVLVAVGATFAFFLVLDAVLESGSREPTVRTLGILTGVLSLLAAGLITWAVFEIHRGARRRAYGPAVRPLYAGVVVASAALSVGLGGLGQARFIRAAVRAATGEEASLLPLLGVVLGLSTGVVVALALFHGLLWIRPDRWFFTGTAVLLAVVGAGVFAQGVNNLQFADVFGGDLAPVYNVYSEVPLDTWYGMALASTVGFSPFPTALQVTVWFLYPVPVLLLLLAPIRFGRSVGGAGAEE
ncbi:FTR1 family protein [Streptomyces tsukubensis]